MLDLSKLSKELRKKLSPLDLEALELAGWSEEQIEAMEKFHPQWEEQTTI